MLPIIRGHPVVNSIDLFIIIYLFIKVLGHINGRPVDTESGIILLLSDGAENRAPYIDDVKDEIVEAGIIVDAVAFTQQAEPKMFELAVLTGTLPTEICFIIQIDIYR